MQHTCVEIYTFMIEYEHLSFEMLKTRAFKVDFYEMPVTVENILPKECTFYR